MSHDEVYKYFVLYFPAYADGNVDVWFANGKNSIRIRQTNGQEFVFTYDGKQDWKLETVKSFIKNIKGGKINV